jgi:hypothetical protein
MVYILDDDFVTDSDLLMACTILQKQIEHIDGKKENIVVPSVAMAKIHEKQEADNLLRNSTSGDAYTNDIIEARAREQDVSGTLTTSSSNSNDAEMTTSLSNNNETNTQTLAVDIEGTPCVLCSTEEWYPALIPCGYLRHPSPSQALVSITTNVTLQI